MIFDVVVVGTGFGGAVTAARLAQAGARVCILERGGWWGGTDESDPRARRPFPRGVPSVLKAVRNVDVRRGPVRRNIGVDHRGLFELSLFRDLDILTASGVGGGSLISANVLTKPDPSFFGAPWPEELRDGELAPYFDRARAMLRPVTIDAKEWIPQKNLAFVRTAQVLRRERDVVEAPIGVTLGDPEQQCTVHNTAGVVQRTCTHCGNCTLGCNDRAKNSLDLTYVPLALAAGAELRTSAEAEGIAANRDGWEVRYIDHATGRRRKVRGVQLVLAAGTIGTLKILLRSRDRFRTLHGLSPRLGTGFGTNGDQGAFVGGTSQLVAGHSGPSSAAWLETRDADGEVRLSVTELGLPLAGLGLPQLLLDRLATSQAYLVAGAGDMTGGVRWNGDGLDVESSRHDNPELFAEIDAELRTLADSLGAERFVGRLATQRRWGAGGTLHPLGGAPMGDSPDTGVVDHTGQVFGTEGLFIADGSLYPRAPGLAPSLTIAALAERIADLMIED